MVDFNFSDYLASDIDDPIIYCDIFATKYKTIAQALSLEHSYDDNTSGWYKLRLLTICFYELTQHLSLHQIFHLGQFSPKFGSHWL